MPAPANPLAFLEGYARSHDPHYFAVDGVLRLRDQVFIGRDAIARGLRRVYAEPFSEPCICVDDVTFDDATGQGMIKLRLRGRHTDALLGFRPTYRMLELSIYSMYELGDPEIQCEHLFVDTSALELRGSG